MRVLVSLFLRSFLLSLTCFFKGIGQNAAVSLLAVPLLMVERCNLLSRLSLMFVGVQELSRPAHGEQGSLARAACRRSV